MMNLYWKLSPVLFPCTGNCCFRNSEDWGKRILWGLSTCDEGTRCHSVVTSVLWHVNIDVGCRRRLLSVGLSCATHWSPFWMNNTESCGLEEKTGWQWTLENQGVQTVTRHLLFSRAPFHSLSTRGSFHKHPPFNVPYCPMKTEIK